MQSNTGTGGVSSSATGAMVTGLMSSAKERWEGSKGQEMMSSISGNIPQGTKDYVQQIQGKLINPKKIRSATVYFGFGEERPFFVEKNPQLLAERLKHNFQFFYLNYAIVTAILFVLTLLISPSAIVGIGLLGLAWMSVVKATSSGSVTIKGITISQKQASVVMTIISGFVLFYILSNVFWYTLTTSGIVICAHALFRDASLHKDEEDRVQMSGDLGEDASFLNPAAEAGNNVV